MNQKFTFLSVLCLLFLISCQKGDVGPAGATGPDPSAQFVNGSFSGKITGKKKDGSTLNETFNYTYSYGPEGYSTTEPATLYLNRTETYNGSNYLHLALVATNRGQANRNIVLQNNSNSNYLRFSKEISSTELFTVNANLILNSYNVLMPIDPANTSYHLVFNFYYYGPGSYNINNPYLYENNNSYPGFSTSNGETVYFTYPNGTYAGGTFYKIVDSAGNASTSSPTYGNLKLMYDSNYHFYFINQNGTNLSKTVAVSADTYSITNYVYDATTSSLSFDFILNFGGYPFPNSTTYPLTVTGSFKGKVYDKITNGMVKADEGFTH